MGAVAAVLAGRGFLRIERRAAAEKIASGDQVEARLRDTFQALSAAALRQNNQSFLALAKTSLSEFQKGATRDLDPRRLSIDGLLKPIRESLDRVDSQLHKVEKERHGHYHVLSEQLKLVAFSQEKLHLETANLVNALRAPNVRGRWGEMQLKRVVEMAGMLEYCDLEVHKSISTETGALRPDLVVKLPAGKNIIVDAKAPFRPISRPWTLPTTPCASSS